MLDGSMKVLSGVPKKISTARRVGKVPKTAVQVSFVLLNPLLRSPLFYFSREPQIQLAHP
jgi:hypothetical protein